MSPSSNGSSSAKDFALEYFAASGFAASINYPLWRSAAIGQSGFVVRGLSVAGMPIPSAVAPYFYGFLPPYKGLVATVFGMTWARAAIFWGSDAIRDFLKDRGYSDSVATAAPPLVVSSFVQVANQPIIRATITLQDPKCNVPNVWRALQHIYAQHGYRGLWHGTSAGILKTVPKYMTAVVVKDWMEQSLPEADTPGEKLQRSAIKSAAAGVAGAALTNPLDVIRNEMFKTNHSLFRTVRELYAETGYGFIVRGMNKNIVAVAIPVACTIFFTDALVQMSIQRRQQ
jgi:hypothetical protein